MTISKKDGPAGTSSAQGEPGTGCGPAPDITKPLPAEVQTLGDQVLPPEEGGPAPQMKPSGEVVEEIIGDFRGALTKDGEGHRLPAVLGRILGISLIRCDMAQAAPAGALPQNADQVEPAADKMLTAIKTVPGAAGVLDVPVARLEEPLGRVRFQDELLSNTEWFVNQVKGHRAQTLRELNQVVRVSIGGADSVIRRTPRLLTALEMPLKLVSGPGVQAAETRKDHEKVAAKAVAEHVRKSPPPGPTGPTGPSGTGGTPPAPGGETPSGTAPQPPHHPHPHHKKK